MWLGITQALIGGLLLGAVYALFSSGLTLVWGMMGVINFAHGDFVMLGMYVALVIWELFTVGAGAFVPIATIILATLGIVVYFGLVKRIMKGPMIAQILGTFGLALVLRYSVFWGFGANVQSLPDSILGGTLILGPIRVEFSRLIAGVVGLLVTIGLQLFLARTPIGSRMMAVSEDPLAAQLMGIHPARMQAFAWALAGAATGVAGALIATFFPISPMAGQALLIIAFVTVTLGGFGSVTGALIAGLLIGVLQSLSAFLISPVYKDIVVYSLFVAVLWVRPNGLLGSATK